MVQPGAFSTCQYKLGLCLGTTKYSKAANAGPALVPKAPAVTKPAGDGPRGNWIGIRNITSINGPGRSKSSNQTTKNDHGQGVTGQGGSVDETSRHLTDTRKDECTLVGKFVVHQL